MKINKKILLWEVLILVFALWIFIILVVGAVTTFTEAKKINCEKFKTQNEAQEFYSSNPIKYRRLDGNKNKVACEHLK